MKTETTISLEPDLLSELNRLIATNGHGSLSEVIEGLLRDFLAKEKRPTYDVRELELINLHADRLNQEAEDVFAYALELS